MRYRYRSLWQRWAAALVLVGLAAAVQATSLSINPVRATLEDARAIESITVRNNGDRAVVLQASPMDWSVVDNEARYAASDVLVVTPPVFTVGPGQEQVVRVGLDSAVATDTERAFRIFFEQSPASPVAGPSAGADDATRIRLNLRIGIPVFLSPAAPPRKDIAWHATREGGDAIRVVGENLGNVHARISRLAILDGQGRVLAESDRLTYLLPASTRVWRFELPAAPVRAPHRLRFRSQDGVAEAKLRSE